jgi:hypothetical protein
MKMLASRSVPNFKKASSLKSIVSNTVRIARLKLLFIATKVVKAANRDKVKYSVHDARTLEMIGFLHFLDTRRVQPKPWHSPGGWPQRFALPV